MDGLTAGIANVGLQWITQEIGVDPFLGALGSNIIGAALEGMLNHQNIFVNIGENMAEGIMSLFTLGGAGNDAWSRAVYISKVLDFSKIVREEGILSAIETYATAIFHQQTIDMIVKDGGILDMVTNKAEVYTDDDGILRKRLWATYQKDYYIDVDMESGVLLEKFERINDVDVLVKQLYDVDAEGNIITKGKIVEEKFDDGLRKALFHNVRNGHCFFGSC